MNDRMNLFDRFKKQLSELNAICLENEWKGVSAKYHVRCKNGHDTWPTPHNINKGQGVCGICVYRADKNNNQISFYKRLAEADAISLEKEWTNTITPHRILCCNGHIIAPRPYDVIHSKEICKICAGKDSDTAEYNFITILENVDAIWLDNEWRGNHVLYSVQCSVGHISKIMPSAISQKGWWDCPECTNQGFDVLYVLSHINNKSIKFGITNGNGHIRLMKHALNGYSNIIILYTNMPLNLPLYIETIIKRKLIVSGKIPVYGNEYFDIECLPIVLEIIDRMYQISKDETMVNVI